MLAPFWSCSCWLTEPTKVPRQSQCVGVDQWSFRLRRWFRSKTTACLCTPVTRWSSWESELVSGSRREGSRGLPPYAPMWIVRHTRTIEQRSRFRAWSRVYAGVLTIAPTCAPAGYLLSAAVCLERVASRRGDCADRSDRLHDCKRGLRSKLSHTHMVLARSLRDRQE